ncbi:Nif3-like dinuclear metal center hexameric protein [bacterium]|nr:Nif3-like dinuclear metal center hexameric protein [bacterium]
MTTKEIYNLAIQMGIKTDFRGEEGVKKLLERRKQEYEKLSPEEKEKFDLESLENPFSDSRILHIAQDKEIKKVLVGIDIEPAEILMAKELGEIDLIISHHPLGKALATLHEVMELQCDVLNQYGVPINIAEKLMKERMSEVARGLNRVNHQRTVDAAKLLGFNLMCLHTVCDNLAAKFLKEKIETLKPERLGDLMNLLEEIPEYKEAQKIGAGPKIFVGDKKNRCGKIALTEITGGTEGSPKLYEKMAQVGIGTIVGMHISEEHKKEAETSLLNVVIAGHISSDSLGVNLFLDELEKRGVEIVPCSGLIRVSRN